MIAKQATKDATCALLVDVLLRLRRRWIPAASHLHARARRAGAGKQAADVHPVAAHNQRRATGPLGKRASKFIVCNIPLAVTPRLLIRRKAVRGTSAKAGHVAVAPAGWQRAGEAIAAQVKTFEQRQVHQKWSERAIEVIARQVRLLEQLEIFPRRGYDALDGILRQVERFEKLETTVAFRQNAAELVARETKRCQAAS